MEKFTYGESPYGYLNLIREHLREGHAALLVGAGFSRNADKLDKAVPDIPLWRDLAEVFAEKLAASKEEQSALRHIDPLKLAERVEAIYGRPELDRLLLDHIQEQNYLPSTLYYKLLALPWSDIFTTNYDTLLERASDEVTEKNFRIVTTKEDLIGSSGTPRIVKLHGTFPSHRPFIITAEDYRTYPQKFAPLVNTVQQCLLENTLCLIGFSGDDPNFQKWTGWIRDNLGVENTPNIYLLLHEPPSAAEQKLMLRKNIIPVDLSQLSRDRSAKAVYEAALNYLQCGQMTEPLARWNLEYTFSDTHGSIVSMESALESLRDLHRSYPGWITTPYAQLESLRLRVLKPARQILFLYCNDLKERPVSDLELEYLYEYDWLRERSLLPPFAHELHCYHAILDRHPCGSSKWKIAIQLSLMRDLRESGKWSEWEQLGHSLREQIAHLDAEQRQQLHWEECLYSMARYQFRELAEKLENWDTRPEMSLWVLRKAGLLAEYGNLSAAYELLHQGILDIRRRLSRQRQVNWKLLSQESAMIELKRYISQAMEWAPLSLDNNGSKEGKQAASIKESDNVHLNTMRTQDHSLYEDETQALREDDEWIDSRHEALHSRYHVSWEEQNISFSTLLSAAWKPFQTRQPQPSFDFGPRRFSSHFEEDKERILAYSFLRFREETGIPFLINNVHYGKDAACGAAERIAGGSPEWSVLTLVQADDPKAVATALTRSVLSTWPQEKADQLCHLYMDAISHTESELLPGDWFYRRSFARLAADVLPEVLSELCSRCSEKVLDRLLDLLEELYRSEKKLCYQQAKSLTKRVLAAYPREKTKELILRLLDFPTLDRPIPESSYYPEPFIYVPHTDEPDPTPPELPLQKVDALFAQYQDGNTHAMTRLGYCLEHGLLTAQQKRTLRDLLWRNGQFHAPDGWLQTICLRLPAPEGTDPVLYLADRAVTCAQGYIDPKDRPKNDFDILNEISAIALARKNAFSQSQLSVLLCAFAARFASLSHNVRPDALDIMGQTEVYKTQMYSILHTLWLVTACADPRKPSKADRQNMHKILSVCKDINMTHFGIQSLWEQLLGETAAPAVTLTDCLCHPDKRCSEWGYHVLATSIRHFEQELLPEEEIRSGLLSIAHQIQWRAPYQLSLALQVAEVTVKYRPELLTHDVMKPLTAGLAHLARQTEIKEDDPEDTAASKGELRVCTARLARHIRQNDCLQEYFQALDPWMQILQDLQEFAEIRNA